MYKRQVFEPLAAGEILNLLQRALADDERGLGKLDLEAEPEALRHLADRANGDARTALNALELSVIIAERRDGKIMITAETAAEALRSRAYTYDRAGDDHYDIASALIKSIRGSDPDAALYWIARMLKGGEDPLFIARRLVISAAEDIGNADPQALVLAVAASQAVQLIGLPEGRIPLAQAAAYLAAAPKSNASYKAIEEALAAVEESGSYRVPAHLRGTGLSLIHILKASGEKGSAGPLLPFISARALFSRCRRKISAATRCTASITGLTPQRRSRSMPPAGGADVSLPWAQPPAVFSRRRQTRKEL